MAMLAGKCALITGASRGIGAAIAERFIAEGARVMIACRSKPALLAKDSSGRLFWQATDITRSEDVDHLFEIAAQRFGKIDILVNNAGVQLDKTIADTSDQEWDWLNSVNLKGTFLCSRAAVRHMREHGGGAIINIGSVGGEVADYGLAIYNASKAWVHGLTRSIATDHGPQGIRCNAICPGWTMTELSTQLFEQEPDPVAAKQGAINRHPLKRLGKPTDIASMAAWLASDDAAFASGQLFTIDGGMTAASQINPALDFR